tara:strand:- start:84 stop:488 length:405 start_codon:yes stop_codon:yes gene_type:complete
MNNKERKAWLRIVEAFLAILIIIGAVLVILSRQEQGAEIDDSVYEKQRQILEIISKNNSLRTEVVSGDNTKINESISKLISPSWNFATNICELDNICSKPGDYQDTEVFATEIIITSNLTNYSPKKLRFFVWGK